MAIALVSHVQFASGLSGGTSGAINTTGANLLIAAVAWTNGVTLVPTLSDNQSNVWMQFAGLMEDQGNCSLWIYYVQAPTVAASHTFTVGTGSAGPCLSVAAFSGVATASPAGLAVRNSSAGATTLQAGSITPPTNNNLVLTAVGYRDTTALSVDSGFIITDQAVFSSGNHLGGSLAYSIQTTATAVNPKWSWTNSAIVSAINAVFQSPSGSLPGTGPVFSVIGSGVIRA